jgi:NADH-quinone oxidoreductase subunit L
MAGDEGYRRFFSYMNLFVGFMLILVLADNFLLLYLGWEGVGLCSFLLIGFWYRVPANGAAARKAFIVTRVGDVAFLIGLILIASNLGTLNIAESAQRATAAWPRASLMAGLAAFLLLAGAVGKSAQLPLQTWLPDAMAGPSPVSALIHAATMVTAGVYLIARTRVFFDLSPQARAAVAIIGAATLLIAGASALAQRDLKRVLAYSTMSQIGYMFLALGVSAWTGAMFHLFTHAFFKALLFLAAGAIIKAQGDEHDIFRMGGLARKMPLVFWTFLVGALALSALPPVTSGWASKDAIIQAAWAGGDSGHLLWLAAVAGALLTSTYTFRALFLVFGGAPSHEGGHKKAEGGGALAAAVLVVLAALCLIAGLLDFPKELGGSPYFGNFLGAQAQTEGAAAPLGLYLPLIVSLVGIPLGFLAARSGRRAQALPVPAWKRFFLGGWGFDRAYAFLVVKPITGLARLISSDFIDWAWEGLGKLGLLGSRALGLSQSGKIRWYAFAIAEGGLLILVAVAL